MIYMLLTDGFEDIEALETLDILRRAELITKTVGIKEKNVTSSHNVTVISDIMLDEISLSDLDMLILPGGPGHTAFNDSEKVQELIKFADANNKYICAICAAPSVIGKLGLLNGKKFTCFPGYEDKCTGGIYTASKAETDDKIITARGAGCASDFGFAIVELLKGKEFADMLKKQMQY